MPLQQFDEAELHAKALQLGLVQEGEELPRNQRSRVAAALLEEKKPRPGKAAEPVYAKEIVVQPGGDITVDGQPFPWLIANVPMEISLNPGGISTVRLTLLTESVQVTKPKTSENESE